MMDSTYTSATLGGSEHMSTSTGPSNTTAGSARIAIASSNTVTALWSYPECGAGLPAGAADPAACSLKLSTCGYAEQVSATQILLRPRRP